MKKITLIAVVCIGLISCLKNKAEPVDKEIPTGQVDPNCPDTILFSSQVMNDIFTTSCNGCHSSGGSGASAGVFTNHANIANDADVILKTLKHESGVSAMPIGGAKLNDSLINTFDCWIKQGKMDN